MKHRSIISLFVVSLFFVAQAQQIDTKKHRIQWEGIDVWRTAFSSKKVLSFDQAKYISDNDDLPYYVETRNAKDTIDYQVQLLHPQYKELSQQEVELLDTAIIPRKPLIRTQKSYSKGECFLEINLLPFVKQNNKYFRLTDFDFDVTESPILPQQRVVNNHTYAKKSVLSNGKFIKIAVTETGIHKLTYETIEEMGINPQKVRIFGYGGALLTQDFTQAKIDDLPEVSIWIEKGADGVFNQGDYILFYAQGIVKWSYDDNKQMFTHTHNHYAKEGYYFVTSDVGVGKTITQASSEQPPADAIVHDVNTFVDYQVHEEEKINIGNTGKVFYGEIFKSKLSYKIPFNFPNIVQNKNVIARFDVAAKSSQTSLFRVTLNNTSPNEIKVNLTTDNDNFVLGKATNKIIQQNNTQAALNYTISYTKPNSFSVGYLNYIEVNAERELKMVGNTLYFRNIKNVNTDSYTRYTISDTNTDTKIWDITNPTDIKEINSTQIGNTTTFIANNNTFKQYVAINTNNQIGAIQPKIIGKIPNQNLHAIPQTDYLIITHPRFIEQANRLAQAHREINHFNVTVATTEQVYNEFSSGTPDISAYRWMAKMFYDRAIQNGQNDKAIKYLLLFGRGSFDNRGIIPNSGDNLILTYQADNSLHLISSYITDDYIGLLDNREGLNIRTEKIDIGLGRFPVSTVAQAEAVVNKTIGYMQNNIYGNWKNKLTFLADDGDRALHVKQLDGIAKSLQLKKSDYQFNKIYLDAYSIEKGASGDRYPLAETALQNTLQTGSLMLNYMGHAGASGLAHEKVLLTNDIIDLYNPKLPLWVTATCDFILFDVRNISAGEHVLLNPNGGGVALYSAARTVYASGNEQLNKFFTYKLFDNSSGEYPRLGDAVRYSKNAVGGDENKLSYILFGDPALRLNYPEDYNIVTETINENPVTGKEIFNALTTQKISGSIQDKNKNIVTDFNGKVEITIYDKVQKITTLNNRKDGDYTYSDRPNILYSGKVNVVDGKFSFTFMVPKDIQYNFGTGRISYYAADTLREKEAQGSYEQFTVGGASPNYEQDEEGPNVDIYLNTPDFKSEDKVNETPLFVANISDKTGINTSSNGIGHDLRLTIDNDIEKSYTLNSFFESDPSIYNKGSLKFKIPELSDGKHTLTFRVWDLMNNSTNVSINFEVVKGLEPTIFSVSNYPNPVKSETKFIISHNRPEVVIESTVDVYDLTGRHIYTATANGTEGIVWKTEDNAGNKIQNGIYLYKISIKTANSKLVSKANKIIVNRQ